MASPPVVDIDALKAQLAEATTENLKFKFTIQQQLYAMGELQKEVERLEVLLIVTKTVKQMEIQNLTESLGNYQESHNFELESNIENTIKIHELEGDVEEYVEMMEALENKLHIKNDQLKAANKKIEDLQEALNTSDENPSTEVPPETLVGSQDLKQVKRAYSQIKRAYNYMVQIAQKRQENIESLQNELQKLKEKELPPK